MFVDPQEMLEAQCKQHGINSRQWILPDVFKSAIFFIIHDLDLPGPGKVGNRDSVPVPYPIQHITILVWFS